MLLGTTYILFFCINFKLVALIPLQVQDVQRHNQNIECLEQYFYADNDLQKGNPQ